MPDTVIVSLIDQPRTVGPWLDMQFRAGRGIRGALGAAVAACLPPPWPHGDHLLADSASISSEAQPWQDPQPQGVGRHTQRQQPVCQNRHQSRPD
jgi:hypothetical protein